MAELGSDSLWKNTAGIDSVAARDLAARLETRGRASDEIEARSAYLGLLGIADGERVLDVGCGSGVVTRHIATLVGPQGHVVGVDPSGNLLTVARELAAESGVADRIEFREGHALALPFPDNAFDAVVAVTVLAHAIGGEAAVPELARVVRPGGRVGVFDFDSDMTLFTHPNREMTRRIVASSADAVAIDGWIGRRMPALFTRAGLTDIRVRGFFPIETDPKGFYVGLAERSAGAAVRSGAVTAEESRRWLEAFRAQMATGPVIAGRLHLFVWGRKA